MLDLDHTRHGLFTIFYGLYADFAGARSRHMTSSNTSMALETLQQSKLQPSRLRLESAEILFLQRYVKTTHIGYLILHDIQVLHKRQPRIVRRQNSPQFVSCSDSQKDTILDAVKGAEDYAQQAADYLEQVNSGTDRYTTWFGEYDQGRVSKVASHFKAITGKATQSTYDCSPSECGNASTFAYVYPTQPGKVYLCGAFWNAPV